MKYPTLAQADVKGKRVLVRVDHNVELKDGKLKNDEKIRASLPTIEFLLKNGARIILMTHVGRPKGKVNPDLSTVHVAKRLEELLKNVPVKHMTTTVGSEIEKAAAALKSGEILYLENVRFHPEEEGEADQQSAFGEKLAALADIYVNEAFPSLHVYEEASTCAVARLLPACMGIHLEKEISFLGTILDGAKRPLTLVMSGAKMETKIPVIEFFLEKGDNILLGGCIANTFIAAKGFDVGSSKYEENFVEQAQNMMLESDKKGKAKIYVPTDAVLASSPESTEKVDLPVEDIEGDMSIFDVGSKTVRQYGDVIKQSGTVVWNGPLGLYETKIFAEGSKYIATTVNEATEKGVVSVIGGGDTLDFHVRYGIPLDRYTFVSTGGGALLEFLSGKPFPALQALQK